MTPSDLPAPEAAATHKQPHPGSAAALELGCICAVLDNNHGLFAPRPPDDWWITEGCPVHAVRAERRLDEA